MARDTFQPSSAQFNGHKWDDPANWSSGLPGSDDVAAVPADAFLEQGDSFTVAGVDLSGSLSIDGGALTVTGSGIQGAAFTVESGAAFEVDDPPISSPDSGSVSPATLTVTGGLSNSNDIAFGPKATVNIDTLTNQTGAHAILGGATTIGTLNNSGELTLSQLTEPVGVEVAVSGALNNLGRAFFGLQGATSTQIDLCSIGELVDGDATPGGTVGVVQFDNVLATIGSVENYGLPAANTEGGIVIGFFKGDSESKVTVNGAFLNYGAVGIGDDNSTDTSLKVNGALTNETTGGIEIKDSNVTVGTLTNSGVEVSGVGGIGIDRGAKDGAENVASDVTVTENFTNTGDIGIGNGTSGDQSTQVTVEGTLDNQSGGGIDIANGTLDVGNASNEAGGTTATGSASGIGVDSLSGELGGGTLSIGGAFTNTGYLAIGNSGISAITSASIHLALNNAGGSIFVSGSTQNDTAGLSYLFLHITPSTWSGNLYLNGAAFVQMVDNGQITTIAANSLISIDGSQAFIEDSEKQVENSALDGLSQINGELDLEDGVKLTTSSLTTGSAGALDIDMDVDDGDSLSNLLVTGALTNNGSVNVGSFASVETQVSLGSVVNSASGSINLIQGQLSATDSGSTSGNFTNDGSLAIGGSNASISTLPLLKVAGTLDNQAGASFDFESGDLTAANLTNEASDASTGFEIGTATADTASPTVTVTNIFTNRGSVEIGNSADAPTVEIGKLDNEAVGNVAASFDLNGGALTVDGLTNDANSTIAVDASDTSSSDGTLTVHGLVGNNGAIVAGFLGLASTVTIGSLVNQSSGSVDVNNSVFTVSGSVTNLGNLEIGTQSQALTTFGSFDNENDATIDRGGLTVTGNLANNESDPQASGIDVDAGELKVEGALSGSGTITLHNTGGLEIGGAASGGAIAFASGTQSELKFDTATESDEDLVGIGLGDTIDLAGLKFSSGVSTLMKTDASGLGASLEIDQGSAAAIVANLDLQSTLSGVLPVLQEDATGGTLVTLALDPAVQASPGSIVVANIHGQSYTAYEEDFSPGTYQGTEYFFTSPPQGATYSSYAYLYSPGNDFIESSFDYTNLTSEPYTDEQVNYDGGGSLASVDFTGVKGTGYSSYEYDYTGGVFSGSRFNYTSAPQGATYSSYETDYDENNNFIGDRFFFTDIAGQSYTNEEEDFDAGGHLARAILSGFGGHAPYSSLELDYDAGAYKGYKATYASSGGVYAEEEVDVNASNQITNIVYSGLKPSTSAYSSLEEDYTGGTLTGEVYDFTNVIGKNFYSYQVTEDGAGNALQDTLDNNNGSHKIKALADNQTLTSLGNDTMTGDGATTFVLYAIYGADTITNFNSDDTILLSAADFSQLSGAIQNGNYGSGNSTLTFGDGDTLTFTNMTQSGLTALKSHFSSHA